MKSKNLLIFLILLSQLGSTLVNAEETTNYDFSSTKAYIGRGYTIIYPVGGFENELAILSKKLDSIVPFIESYAGFKFENLTVVIVKDPSDIGGVYGRAYPWLEKLEITADSYDSPVFEHEACHLSQKPFNFPAWFGEGQANNCAIKLFIVGNPDLKPDFAKALDEGLTSLYEKEFGEFKEMDTNVPDYISTKGEDSPAKRKKSHGSYVLMKEVLKVADITAFYVNLRSDKRFKDEQNLLTNDVIICKLNEIATSDVFNIFYKYGFSRIESCEKVYADYEIKVNPPEVKEIGKQAEIKVNQSAVKEVKQADIKINQYDVLKNENQYDYTYYKYIIAIIVVSIITIGIRIFKRTKK